MRDRKDLYKSARFHVLFAHSDSLIHLGIPGSSPERRSKKRQTVGHSVAPRYSYGQLGCTFCSWIRPKGYEGDGFREKLGFEKKRAQEPVWVFAN